MKQPSFDKAFEEVEKIVRQIENETVSVDELAAKVKQAKALIKLCEDKLRGIEKELNQEKGEEENVGLPF